MLLAKLLQINPAMLHSYTQEGENFCHCWHTHTHIATGWSLCYWLMHSHFDIPSIGIESTNKCHLLNRVEMNVHQIEWKFYREPFTLMAFPSSKVKQQQQQQRKQEREVASNKGTMPRFVLCVGFPSKLFRSTFENSVNGSSTELKNYTKVKKEKKRQQHSLFSLHCNQYSIIKFVTWILFSARIFGPDFYHFEHWLCSRIILFITLC